MDRVFSYAIANVSEPAHAYENILVPGKKSHAHSQRVKDSATRQPRLRLCMSVTKKNVIAGRRGMGNPRFAKCTIRNVCTEPSPSRMGKNT